MTPLPDPISAELAQRIRLVIFDVDGVLTDAGVYIGATEAGESVELKRFHQVGERYARYHSTRFYLLGQHWQCSTELGAA